MAGIAAASTELDDDETDIPVRSGPGNIGVTGTASTESGLTPVEPPLIRQPAGASQDFEVIETDNDGNPLGGETRLTQGETGDRPLVGSGSVEEDNSRKAARHQRRMRQKQGRDHTLNENAALKGKVADLEQRLEQLSGDVSPIKTQLSEIERNRAAQNVNAYANAIAEQNRIFEAAEVRIKDAIIASDGDALLVALRDRDEAVIKRTQYTNQKAHLESQIKPAGTETDAGGTDARTGAERGTRQPPNNPQQELSEPVRQKIADFQQAYPWYTGNPNDPDSLEVLKIDRAVSALGLDPSSDEYWDEVEDMMERRLPHRFSPAAVTRSAPKQTPPQPRARQERGGPPVAGGSARQPGGQPLGKDQVRITPQRKQAMIDAGIIDGTGNVMNGEKYKKVVRQYYEFDRANGSA